MSTSPAKIRASVCSRRYSFMSVKSIGIVRSLIYGKAATAFAPAGNRTVRRTVGRLVCLRALPAAGLGAAVDVKDFAGHECCSLEIKHGVDDLAHFADPAHRLEAG